MKKFIAILSFSLIFLVGCQKEEVPVSPENDSGITLTKVKAPFEGTLKGLSTVNCTTMQLTMNASGFISYLGNYTSVSTADLQPTGQLTGNLINGQHTATNVDGDQIFASWTGSWEVVNTTTYETHYVLIMTFTGGTGPFEGATGQLTAEASGAGAPCSTLEVTAESLTGYIVFNNFVPFIGYMSGTAIGSQACTAGPLNGLTKIVSLNGKMPHFGVSAATLTHCNALNSLTTGILHDGNCVLTAANGDEVWFDYSGGFTLDQPYPNMTSAQLFAGGTITGGTGRFANATGAVYAKGPQDLTTNPTSLGIEIWGFIRY